MNIGVSAVWLNSGRTSKNSGLSRYAKHILDDLIGRDKHKYTIYGPSDFPWPPSWRAKASCNGIKTSKLLKRVMWEHITAGRLARKEDLWFSCSQAIPFSSKRSRAVMIHDLIPVLYPKWHSLRTVLYYRFALKHSCKNAEVILANSKATQADIVKTFDVEPSRIRVTPLGPGNLLEPMDPARVNREELKALGIPYERYFLTLGNIEPRKDLATILQAVNQEPDIGLVCIGGVRSESDSKLQENAPRVKFLGFVADEKLPAVFAGAQGFISASLAEGFGLPVLEAMMLGAPTIASEISAHKEVCEDAAVYFSRGDVYALRQAMHGVMEQDGLREQMRSRGLERSKEFTWHRTGTLTQQSFEGV